MSLDKLVDSTQLDSDLTSVANAIRAKSGGSGQLAFPSGFVSEIGNIPSGGGGGFVLLGSGSYTKTSGTNMSIPVSYTGTPKVICVRVHSALEATAQGFLVQKYCVTASDIGYPSALNGEGMAYAVMKKADGSWTDGAYNPKSIVLSSTTLTVNRINATYPWQSNTYDWYIWGEAAST